MKTNRKEFLVFSAICFLLIGHGVVVALVNSGDPLRGHVNLHGRVRAVDRHMKKGLAEVSLTSGKTVRFSFVDDSVADKINHESLHGHTVRIAAIPSRFKDLYDGRSLQLDSTVLYDIGLFIRERKRSRDFFVRLAFIAAITWICLGVLPYHYRGRVLFARPQEGTELDHESTDSDQPITR